MVPSRFGPSTAVFRSYRIPDDDSRLAGLALSPAPYEALNERIAAYELLGPDDEPGTNRRRKTSATTKKKKPSKKD